MFKEHEDIDAYAKLQGLNFLKFIKKTNIYLGKEMDITMLSKDEDVIYLTNEDEGNRLGLLDRHAKIYWDNRRAMWYIKNLSNQPIYINKSKVKPYDTRQ